MFGTKLLSCDQHRVRPACKLVDPMPTCLPPGRLRRYNPRVPLASQLNISGPLLSRFDVIILLLDQVPHQSMLACLLLALSTPSCCSESMGRHWKGTLPDTSLHPLQMSPEWDETVADHILETHHRRGGSKQPTGGSAASGGRQRPQPAEAAEVESQASGAMRPCPPMVDCQRHTCPSHAPSGLGRLLLTVSCPPTAAHAGLAAGPAAPVCGLGQGRLHSGTQRGGGAADVGLLPAAPAGRGAAGRQHWGMLCWRTLRTCGLGVAIGMLPQSLRMRRMVPSAPQQFCVLALQASCTTVRMLESLVRVAQAHARLMARGEVRGRSSPRHAELGGLNTTHFHGILPALLSISSARLASHSAAICIATHAMQVLLQDAVVAVWLIDACSDGHSVLGDMMGGSGGHQPFPDDPDADYARLEQAVTAAVLSQREWNLLT